MAPRQPSHIKNVKELQAALEDLQYIQTAGPERPAQFVRRRRGLDQGEPVPAAQRQRHRRRARLDGLDKRYHDNALTITAHVVARGDERYQRPRRHAADHDRHAHQATDANVQQRRAAHQHHHAARRRRRDEPMNGFDPGDHAAPYIQQTMTGGNTGGNRYHWSDSTSSASGTATASPSACTTSRATSTSRRSATRPRPGAGAHPHQGRPPPSCRPPTSGSSTTGPATTPTAPARPSATPSTRPRVGPRRGPGHAHRHPAAGDHGQPCAVWAAAARARSARSPTSRPWV